MVINFSGGVPRTTTWSSVSLVIITFFLPQSLIYLSPSSILDSLPPSHSTLTINPSKQSTTSPHFTTPPPPSLFALTPTPSSTHVLATISCATRHSLNSASAANNLASHSSIIPYGLAIP